MRGGTLGDLLLFGTGWSALAWTLQRGSGPMVSSDRCVTVRTVVVRSFPEITPRSTLKGTHRQGFGIDDREVQTQDFAQPCLHRGEALLQSLPGLFFRSAMFSVLGLCAGGGLVEGRIRVDLFVLQRLFNATLSVKNRSTKARPWTRESLRCVVEHGAIEVTTCGGRSHAEQSSLRSRVQDSMPPPRPQACIDDRSERQSEAPV